MSYSDKRNMTAKSAGFKAHYRLEPITLLHAAARKTATPANGGVGRGQRSNGGRP